MDNPSSPQPEKKGFEKKGFPKKSFPKKGFPKKGFPKKGGPKKFQKKGFKKGPKKPIPEEVKVLMENYKLNFTIAMKVHTAKITVEEAVNEQKLKDELKVKAQALCDQYKEINFAAACKILKDNSSPEEYLARKQRKKDRLLALELQKKVRMQQDENQTPAYQALEDFIKDQTLLELAQYKGASIKGRIKDFTPYTFNFISQDQESVIHRLSLKYLYKEEHSAMIQKWIIVDKNIQKKQLRPKYKPVDRFQFPEGVLQKGAEIMLALHEGEMIRGTIEWFTPYDIMLKASGKFPLWVFRHAVIECALLKRPPKVEA